MTTRQRGVWWLAPSVAGTTVVSLSVAVTALLPDDVYRRQWNTPKVIDTGTSLLFLTGGLVLALGALVVIALRPARPAAPSWPALSDAQVRLLGRASTVLVALTVTGYIAFVVLGALRGVTLAELLSSFGSAGLYATDLKAQIGTAPGLTTLTQAGPAAVVVSGLVLCCRPTWAELAKLAVVLGLAVPRAFFLTERLAVLELVVPLVAVLAMAAAARPRLRAWTSALPLVAVPAVIGVFALFEYSRSWAYFRTRTDATFAQFIIERLAGYYTTALNNGALQLLHSSYPGRWPRATLEMFWTAPGISDLNLYTMLDGHDPDSAYVQLLETYGNPEFNNASGIADPFLDYGTVGGLVYFLLVGFVVGALHRGSLESRPTGMLFYPIVFLGLLEIPRYLYWAQGRALPAFAGLAVVAVLLRRVQRRADRHRGGADPGADPGLGPWPAPEATGPPHARRLIRTGR